MNSAAFIGQLQHHLMRTWQDPPPTPIPSDLQSAIGGHPLVAAVLARRGFSDLTVARAFLDPAHYAPAPPDDLPGMAQAVRRIHEAIRHRETIAVWGDFDVDGQTATALLVANLRDLGGRVLYHIPVRARESHGVHLPALRKLIDDGIDLLLTCDTGSAAHEAVDFARSQGVDIIITDHHDLPDMLPDALAVINPKLLEPGHPLATLPGVGVAYKLAEALCRQAGRPRQVEQYLDLVALGIVADIAIQTGDTRYLLQRGLQVLRQTQRLSLQIMMELAGLNPDWLTEEHIGFELGPRLNALGRLDDANVAVEFLTTADIGQARIIATQLEGLNNRRKLLTDQIFQGALVQIEREPALLQDAALVLAHPGWEPGVIGIVASRLVERYNRPVVLIATPPGELGRGSARSVDGCNISAAIAEQRDLLASFGGHPMAAGLTIDPENIPRFRRGLVRAVEKMLGDVVVEDTLAIDGYLPLGDLSLELVADLERLAPFGPGNPALTLASQNLTLVSHSSVGRSKDHLLLTVRGAEGASQRVIWWQGAGWPLPQGRFDLAYHVRASTYRGQRDVQVEWVDARPVEEPAATPALRSGASVVEEPAIQVIDYRQAPKPADLLRDLQARGEIAIWCEARNCSANGAADRWNLQPGLPLAIWTTPPGRSELHAVLERVRPRTIYLFAIDPKMDSLEPFLHRLAGLVKHALQARQGRASLPSLAAAAAQREAAVRLGLAWLAVRGNIALLAESGDEILLGPAAASPQSEADPAQIVCQLQALLDETAAYRRYFQQADADTILN